MNKISKNTILNQIYLERFDTSETIFQLNPSVVEIRIATAVEGQEPVKTTLYPDCKYMKRVSCPNDECDNDYIDISNEILDAVKSGKTIEGKKKCEGHLKKYAHNSSPAYDCEVYVRYKIEPVLKQNND